MSTPNRSKTERIDVRASAPVKQLLQEAARARHKNVSELLLDAGVTAAAQTLSAGACQGRYGTRRAPSGCGRIHRTLKK